MTRNHPEAIILLLALHLLGCRAGFVAADAPREDQRDFIDQAGADVLIQDSGAVCGGRRNGGKLHDLVAGELTEAHAPRGVRFVSELPLTHADKVDKRALRAG